MVKNKCTTLTTEKEVYTLQKRKAKKKLKNKTKHNKL